MKFKNLCVVVLLSLLTVSFASSAEELLKRRSTSPSLDCTNGPSQVKDQANFYLVFGDYTEEDGTLKIISHKPLKVHVYPDVVKGDTPDVIDHLVKKALISTLYHVFAFSDVDKVTIISSPKEIDLTRGRKDAKELNSPTYTITKSRAEASNDLRKYTNAKSFGDLFEKNQFCSPSTIAKQFMYDDQGGVGITKFFSQVIK